MNMHIPQQFQQKLMSINLEIYGLYKEFVTSPKTDNGCMVIAESITAVLDYYIESIYKTAKFIANKMINQDTKFNSIEFSEEDIDRINLYKINELGDFNENLLNLMLHYYNDKTDTDKMYQELLDVILQYLTTLFYKTLLLEYKNNGISEVKINTKDNGCTKCRTLAQFSFNIDELISKLDVYYDQCGFTFKPFIKSGISYSVPKTDITFINLPTCYKSTANNTVNGLKINVPELITPMIFKFVDKIEEEMEFINLIGAKYKENSSQIIEQIDGTLVSLKIGDTVLIALNKIDQFEYLVTKHLIQDKLLNQDLTVWSDMFYKKQETKYIGDQFAIYLRPFISYEAEQNPTSYFLENAINYILNPTLLKAIDAESYERIKSMVEQI